MPPVIDMSKCDLCNVCVDICPEDVFMATKQGPIIKYPEECWYCGSCVQDCHLDCIRIVFPVPMRLSALRGER